MRHKQQFAKVVAAGWSTHRAVLISKSAARLWGMWVISREGEEVELAVPSGSVPPRRLTAKGYRYRRVKSLQESTVSIAGVRATNPARTCLEIARLHGFPDGLVATDSALGRHDVTTYDLREELEKCSARGDKRSCVRLSSTRMVDRNRPMSPICEHLLLSVSHR